MGFTMPPVLNLVAMACAGLGLVLQIVGLATPGWALLVVGDVDVEVGLWKQCAMGICVDLDFYTSIPDWVNACRAFGILAVLLLAGGVAVAVIACFVKIDTVPMPLVSAVLAFVAAVCCLVEFAVYAGKSDITDTSGASYGYSFALTIVACLLALAAGVCFIMGRTRS